MYTYLHVTKISKRCGDVGMAMPKATQTRYMDGSVQATQRTTQVTPSLHPFCYPHKAVSIVSQQG